MMSSTNNEDKLGSELSCTVVYCKYDAMRLAGAIGESRVAQLLQSADKAVHVLVTGD